MKVLVISNLCPPDYDGGFELSALRNAESLRALGHEVEFVTGEYRPAFQGEKFDPDWIHRIFRLPESKDGWSSAEMFLEGDFDLQFKFKSISKQVGLRFANIQSLVQMLQVAPDNEAALDAFLAEKEFDVAYIFGLHKIGTSLVRSLSRKGIPVVYHQGDEWLASYLEPGLLKRMMLNVASPVTFRREREVNVDNVVLVSEFLKGKFLQRGFTPKSVDVIPRGVEFPLTLNLEPERFGPPVFLVAARLTYYKGIQFAIRAAAALDKKEPQREWELWIAGHGDPVAMKKFADLVAELNVGHRVSFLGKHSRESVFGFMRRATAVISPSVFDEPFGNTNIEALAAGTVLIASRSGAIEEIIEHGKSGLIYERNNFDQLARHMKEVLDQPEMRRNMQQAGHQRVSEKFTQDRIMAKVELKLMEVSGCEAGNEYRVVASAPLR
jgi:glycosyltransferase involved in cell wall biosynthesis